MSATVDRAKSSARPRSSRARRWWKRKPINRFLVLLHRWPALLLGLLLVVETTSGAILVYNGEIFRATHGELYRTSAAAPAEIDVDRSLAAVRAAHPDFDASWVARDQGVDVVGNADYDTLYFLDPATSRINGSGNLDLGVMGFLVNLHDCGLTCEGYPGYSGWLAAPLHEDGVLTRGGLVLGILGLLMILLALTSLRIWWPGWKRLRSRFVVRRGKGRFARDFDLHNVVGAASLLPVLLWGVTGAAFEMPVVETAWLKITGGSTAAEPEFSLTPHKVAAGTPEITSAQAVAAARQAVREEQRVGSVYAPTKDTPFWEVDLVGPQAASAHRAVYNGDVYALVDPRDAGHVKVIGESEGPLSNRLYEKVFEPSHFGWNVNAWWRIVWLLFGLAPLVLMVTGISTWLWRRAVKKRRKAAGRTRLSDAELSDALDHAADDRAANDQAPVADPDPDHEPVGSR